MYYIMFILNGLKRFSVLFILEFSGGNSKVTSAFLKSSTRVSSLKVKGYGRIMNFGVTTQRCVSYYNIKFYLHSTKYYNNSQFIQT